MSTGYLLIFCTCPNNSCATKLATKLVTEKLAACVSIIPTLKSFYLWKNKLEISEECLLFIKTTEHSYQTIESFIKREHPYELPEIVATSITQGAVSYLNWITSSISK